MKSYRYNEQPFKVFGVPFFEQTGKLERLPAQLREQIPDLAFLGRRCPGARLCFRTNAKEFTVKIELETLSCDSGMSLFSCQSANVLIGDRKNARFAGIVNPPNYNTKVFEKKFYKSGETEDVTIFFPRNEVVADMLITVADDAVVEPPTPYRHAKPIVYYGSSITEGGHSGRVTNVYNAVISNHLDVDYYNLGFSGGAKGELAMADYINTMEMSIFVLDYDHNAPTPEFLRATHEPFFRRIREKHPDLPILMLSGPDFDYDPEKPERRDIIRETYLHATEHGDRHVRFIDGSTFFGEKDRHFCTNDCIHPNDLGFYRMAQTIEPVIRELLEADA